MRSKDNADAALDECPSVKNAIVVKRTDLAVQLQPKRDYWWHDVMASESIKLYCDAEELDAEDPQTTHVYLLRNFPPAPYPTSYTSQSALPSLPRISPGHL
ncbi:unnamed protein product [marine sediment metagenome]|uniref:Uncharacterized protein n=1 Tax=marine sediment metagenome TaxID=412755 RepID=X1NZ72_9ZZZZ